MDMYRILENFDAVNSKRTLTEGRMSMSAIDELYQEWVNSEDAPFDSDSGDQNAVLEKAMRFLNGRVRPEQIEDIADMLANHWHGGQGVMGEERRSEADWDAAAISAGKRGRDARDNPSRHAARAKAGQAMRGNAKPDFLDLDRDGDKTEPMKSAAKTGMTESLIDDDSTDIRELLNFNLFRDYDSFKDGDIDPESYSPEEIQAWEQLFAAWGPIAVQLERQINKAAASGAVLTPEQNQEINDNWYDGSDAYDDPLRELPGIYAREIPIIRKILRQSTKVKEGKNPFPGTPEYELRFGKTDAGSAFDKKKISTGTVYSRKHFDEPDAGDDDTPKSAGRPKGTGRKLGAKGPSVASKLLKGKGGLKEHDHEHGMDMHMHNDLDSGEYDQEGDMAQQDLHTVVDAAKELHSILASDENLPEWVQAKITKALDYIDTARDYVKSSHAERGEEEIDEASPPGEFKPGDRVLYMNKFATIIAQDGDAYGIRIDGKPGTMMVPVSQIKKPSYDEGVSEASAAPFKIGDKVIWRYKSGTRVRGVFKGMKDGVDALIYTHPDTFAIPLSRVQPDRGENDGDLYRPGNPTMEEADVEEAGYSAKSARAGKDIGKPGKNFSKIAKGAAERYGSKAAGERVAGAVLNKLRAKEGVEEESADKKDPPFTPDTKSSFKKSTNPNRTNRDSVKALAQKGLADMTTAELKAELKRRSQVEEESTDTRDQHAEKAGKKVTKDIEHDEGHKGRDDAKAEKAGKKVAKDIEYDDKKDKEEKVDETTVSGSVATSAGGDAPKKGKGGMQFGQGVYEGQVAESFEKKLKNVLNEGMSVNVSTDDTGKKSISVNATDSDADALGDMLKMAGLFSSEGYSRACTDCGGIHEMGACGADMVEEELANSPDEVYTDADYMTQTLSGGLNGPKTTGQTTGAVVNRQDSRQGVMAEAGTVIPLGPDPNIELRRAAEQGHRDAMRGIDNNPYFNNSPAGRAYRQGQESFKQETGTNTMPTPADLARRRGDVKEVAERVKTQAESRLWNLYRKI